MFTRQISTYFLILLAHYLARRY